MISYIIPTHDRPEPLAETLAAIGRIEPEAHARIGGAEVIVADNHSAIPAAAPHRLANGTPVHMLRRAKNEGAAARNFAAVRARGDWLVMLDDDSHPVDGLFVDELLGAPADVGAVGAEIFLPDGRHESGGLPEVFTGCGAAIRRRVFLALGGYDPAFEYYAEEYDLAARMIRGGLRIVHAPGFGVLHRKVPDGRNFGRIARRLVRNNGWCDARYAPAARLDQALSETISRYRRIAEREDALDGYEFGLRELHATLPAQPRREMTAEQWDRFTGLAAARAGLRGELSRLGIGCVRVVDEGKNAWAVRQALAELGVQEAADGEAAQALVIGTLSPGPMEDAARRRAGDGVPVVPPWRTGWGAPAPVRGAAFSSF